MIAPAFSFSSNASNACASAVNFVRLMTGSRRRQRQAPVADRDADGLGAEIQPGDDLTGLQRGGDILDCDFWHGPWLESV
jgi:hypothetical protein